MVLKKVSRSIYFDFFSSFPCYLNYKQLVYCAFRASFSGKCYIFCTCSGFFFFFFQHSKWQIVLWFHKKKMYGKSKFILKKRPWKKFHEVYTLTFFSWFLSQGCFFKMILYFPHTFFLIPSKTFVILSAEKVQEYVWTKLHFLKHLPPKQQFTNWVACATFFLKHLLHSFSQMKQDLTKSDKFCCTF